jgi:hypothetical protein
LQGYTIQRIFYENSRFEKNEQITLNLTLKADHFIAHYPPLPIRWTNALSLNYNKGLCQIQIGVGTMNCHPDRIAAAISRHFGEDVNSFHATETELSNDQKSLMPPIIQRMSAHFALRSDAIARRLKSLRNKRTM